MVSTVDMIIPRYFAAAQNDNMYDTSCHSKECNDEESRATQIQRHVDYSPL